MKQVLPETLKISEAPQFLQSIKTSFNSAVAATQAKKLKLFTSTKRCLVVHIKKRFTSYLSPQIPLLSSSAVTAVNSAKYIWSGIYTVQLKSTYSFLS